MKQYNDEALCPEKFEQMAKEYSNQKKQIKMKRINNDYGKKSNLVFDINTNLIDLINYFDILSKYKLSKQNQNNITKLNNIAVGIKKIIDFKTVLQKNTNYCHCLTQCILLCTKVVSSIICLEEFCDDIEYKKYQDLQLDILKMIEILSNMFGVCNYRKV